MDTMMVLPTEPRQDVVPQQVLIVRLCLEAAEEDKNMQAELAANPGQVFANAGFPIDSWALPAFNDYCRKEAGLTNVLVHLGNNGALSALGGIGCTLCKIAAYTVAIAIVAVGAGALSLLTAGSGVVVALAAFAGVAATTALAFIVTLATAISGGIGVVASYICEWTGACT